MSSSRIGLGLDLDLGTGTGTGTGTGQRIVAVKPITVPAPGRSVGLQVKVTAPLSGRNLPVIVFSHGNAWSLDGYEPLVDRWAAAGFIVVQPTHLDSRRNGIGWDDPRFATIWRVRIADLHAVIDGLGDILVQAAWAWRPASTASASRSSATPGARRPPVRSSARACWTPTAFPERTSPTPPSRPAH